MSRVTVVLLARNGRADTLACLASLARLDPPGVSVVLVDNGSTDGTPEAVRAAFPDVEVLEQHANLGFAEGNNVGVRHALDAGAAWVLVANNDTVFAPDTVAALLRAAAADPTIGVACPLIHYVEPPDLIWYAGRTFDPRRGYHGRPHGWMEIDRGQYAGVRDVDTGTGCAMLMPAAAIEAVGPMDPELFLYYEDIDWCLRFRAAGYRVVVVGDARLGHRVSAAGGGEHNPGVYYYGMRNVLEVCRRHAPLRGAANWRRTAEAVTTHAVHVRRAREKRAALRAVAEGYRDFRRGRLGPR